MTDEKTSIHIQSVISQLDILCNFAEIDADEGESARASAYFVALDAARDELNTLLEELQEKTE